MHYFQDKSKAPEKGDTEKTATDRNRARKNKKAEKRKKRKEREQRQKMVEKLNPGLGNKYSKENAMKDLDKISKSGGPVTVIQVSYGLCHFVTFWSVLKEIILLSLLI
jgi:U3 small nucleolar RNA-associated protein MPP10